MCRAVSGRAMRARALLLLALAACARAHELDPAACAPRFDVQRDKIIRTEESRDMGARYLSELDVGARHECLRLCCETDSCDVFVYEEKGPGSCYLFNCGPPEDFRCKFTAHSNFSSGVLALSRHLAELQDQERLAHHEQELANLRTVTSSTASTSTPTPPPPPPPPPPRLTTQALEPAHVPSRCSRYQFECRVGGECIAVYNACDGVAQCADGSDEAPELGCPSPRAPPAPPAPAPAQDMTEAGAAGPASEGAPAERWPHRLAQAQPQHRYSDGGAGSHIFSHKGGLLQAGAGGAPAVQYPPFEPWPRRTWPPQPAPYSPAAGAGGRDTLRLEGASSERGWGGAYPRPDWPEPDPRRAWPVPQPDQELPLYTGAKTMPEEPLVYANAQQTLRDAPKKGFELAPRTPVLTPPPTPAPTPRNITEPKRIETKRLVAAPAEGTPDGLAERPPAAVLLLVLGVLMAAVMCGMVGCRARAARRRRRGKSPFAHDADYLVNGMYL